jgi:hypothetical protein
MAGNRGEKDDKEMGKMRSWGDREGRFLAPHPPHHLIVLTN